METRFCSVFYRIRNPVIDVFSSYENGNDSCENGNKGKLWV